MAPLAAQLAQAFYHADTGRTGRRDLASDTNSTASTDAYTNDQETIIQWLALGFSIVSVLSAILAFYWFLKMRRSFRHDLVMLLIQSDMFKALWFMMYPIVRFVNGPIPNNSRFCQVNGFFLSLAIEASDVAVLMIALHTALYIFKPKVASGEGGLYPYRYVAYTVWLLYPLAMASIAFVDSSTVYTADETYCYLPVRPFWYRLALTWVPRYIIFLVIVGIYASIYFYVRYKFDGFNKVDHAHSELSDCSSKPPDSSPEPVGISPTPQLQLNGLVPDDDEVGLRRRNLSISTMEALQNSPLTPTRSAHRFIWGTLISSSSLSSAEQSTPETSPTIEADPRSDAEMSFGAITSLSLSRGPSLLAASAPVSEPSNFISAGSNHPVSPLHSEATLALSNPSNVSTPSASHPASQNTPGPASWDDPSVQKSALSPAQRSSMDTRVDILTVLDQRPDLSRNPTPVIELTLTNTRGEDIADAEMLRTRDKIRRQLRFLFIYPLVYMGMWIVPFISHVLQYNDRFAAYPPFGLTCVTTICVCSQAAVDCWLFSTREKPWRHIPGNNKSFFGSLKFWTGWKALSSRQRSTGPGKSRDEMDREARAAYMRRDEEIQHRRSEVFHRDAVDPTKAQKSWWEGTGFDGVGAMSPLAEEPSNPMDKAIPAGPSGPPSPSNRTTLRSPETLQLSIAVPGSPALREIPSTDRGGT